MCTFTASAAEPLEYLTNEVQVPLPFATIHFSTPTSPNHIGVAKRFFLRKGIVNAEWRPFGVRNDNPLECQTGTAATVV